MKQWFENIVIWKDTEAQKQTTVTLAQNSELGCESKGAFQKLTALMIEGLSGRSCIFYKVVSDN